MDTTKIEQPKQHKKFDELVANLQVRENVYILGPTGSGKSKGVELAAKFLGLNFYKKLVGGQSTEASFVGYMSAGGQYVEGIAYKPYTEGGVLLIDEIDNGNPNVNLVLNGLSDGSISFPCGMREKHPDFCLIATANTIYGANSEYVGRCRQDAALLNRFVFMKWGYDEELETRLATEEYFKFHPNQNFSEEERTAKYHVEVSKTLNDIRKLRMAIVELKVQHIISPRTILQAMRKLAVGRSKKEIFQSVLIKGLDDDVASKLIKKADMINLVKEAVDDEKFYVTRLAGDDTRYLAKAKSHPAYKQEYDTPNPIAAYSSKKPANNWNT